MSVRREIAPCGAVPRRLRAARPAAVARDERAARFETRLCSRCRTARVATARWRRSRSPAQTIPNRDEVLGAGDVRTRSSGFESPEPEHDPRERLVCDSYGVDAIPGVMRAS
jgi:hypothetical protein